MNHLATIQNEFVKEARKWDDLTYDEQKGYLKRHPGSKRRITARPGKGFVDDKPTRGRMKKLKPLTNLQKRKVREEASGGRDKTKLKDMVGISRIDKRLNSLRTLVDKNPYKLTRNKLFWVLKDAVKKHNLPRGGKPATYGIRTYSAEQDRDLANKLDKLVGRLTDSINKLDARYNKASDAALDYIKKQFVADGKIKTPKSVDELKTVKPKKSKIKKTKAPDTMGVGHRISFRNGNVEATITGVQYGNKWIRVNAETDDGHHWHLKRRSLSYSPDVKFLGQTANDDANRLRKNRHDFDSAISNEKLERRKKGRDKIDELGIRTGDKVLIRGPHYNWSANVVEVDHKQGGVRIDQIRHRRSNPFGLGPSGSGHYRFIPARSIVSKA